MSDKVEVGAKARSGELEWISDHRFDIQEEATMTFEGILCNITNASGDQVMMLGSEDGRVEWRVYEGYKCYVREGWVKLVKKT
ncbi:hypothetical protein N7535_006663 [Penicillium sp. DV-2018c]|nr:hypothetical protein N7461_007254 [Penicillium sp. DV-2018c]KAJ5567357.1 hypothetical protein N7535_006663 [Penicillium sp. DV-2018c]